MRQAYYNQILTRTKKLKDLNYYLKNIDKAIDKALKEIEKENNRKEKDKDISDDEIKKLAQKFGIKSPK
jgi:ribosome recycling factor